MSNEQREDLATVSEYTATSAAQQVTVQRDRPMYASTGPMNDDSGTALRALGSRPSEHVWALVLAGGEGTRLRQLTMTSSGVHIPKQYCSLQGGPSFLQETLRRAKAIAAPGKIGTIVAAQHRRWWDGSVGSTPESNWFVQPENRGTVNGILFGLLHVLQRDPEATLLLLPSDHHCQDEPTLRQSLRQARERLAAKPQEILLLGVQADEPDPELGYIVPATIDRDGVFAIVDFVEKPTRAVAEDLIKRGALWNTLIVAAKGGVLLALIERWYPQIVREMRDAVRRVMANPGNHKPMEEVYARLPSLDFSRNILQRATHDELRVMAVPACGWSDLGTPERIAEVLRRIPNHGKPADLLEEAKVHINLAATQRSLRNAPAAAN